MADLSIHVSVPVYQFPCISSRVAFEQRVRRSIGSHGTTLDHAGPRWLSLDVVASVASGSGVAGVAQNVTRASSWAAEGGTGRRPQPEAAGAADAGAAGALDLSIYLEVNPAVAKATKATGPNPPCLSTEGPSRGT